jgi:hypothetical protein
MFALNRRLDALDYLLEAITAPASEVSSVAVQAWRKARLISLMEHGTDVVLPA